MLNLEELKKREYKVHKLVEQYKQMFQHIKLNFDDNLTLSLVHLSIREKLDVNFQLVELNDVADENYLFFIVDGEPIYGVLQETAVILYKDFLKSNYHELDSIRKDFIHRLNHILLLMTLDYDKIEKEGEEVVKHLIKFLDSIDIKED